MTRSRLCPPPARSDNSGDSLIEVTIKRTLFIVLLAILGGLLLLVSLVLAVHLVLSLYAAGG